MRRCVLLAIVLALVPAAPASAEVVRLRVDWAPSDGRAAMAPPYLFVTSYEGSASHQGPCSTGSNCSAAAGTRWVDENPDAGGQPRTISFVDDTPTQYGTYHFEAAHPFAGFGPNIVGTATITHADGRTYTVNFDIPPGPSSGIPQRIALGDSQGLPRPRGGGGGGGGGAPVPCTIDDLKAHPAFSPLLKASVIEFAERWRTDDRLILNNIYACGRGKITGRVIRVGPGPNVLIANGTKELDFQSPGRAGVKVPATRRGRRLRAQDARFRVKVTIRVFDADGASVTYSRTIRLR